MYYFMVMIKGKNKTVTADAHAEAVEKAKQLAKRNPSIGSIAVFDSGTHECVAGITVTEDTIQTPKRLIPVVTVSVYPS